MVPRCKELALDFEAQDLSGGHRPFEAVADSLIQKTILVKIKIRKKYG